MTAVMLDHEQAHQKTGGGDGDKQRSPPITPGESELAREPQRHERQRRYQEFGNAARMARLAIAAEDLRPVTGLARRGMRIVFDVQDKDHLPLAPIGDRHATRRPAGYGRCLLRISKPIFAGAFWGGRASLREAPHLKPACIWRLAARKTSSCEKSFSAFIRLQLLARGLQAYPSEERRPLLGRKERPPFG